MFLSLILPAINSEFSVTAFSLSHPETSVNIKLEKQFPRFWQALNFRLKADILQNLASDVRTIQVGKFEYAPKIDFGESKGRILQTSKTFQCQ